MKMIYSYSTICFLPKNPDIILQLSGWQKKRGTPIIKEIIRNKKSRPAADHLPESYLRTESKGELSDATILKSISASMA